MLFSDSILSIVKNWKIKNIPEVLTSENIDRCLESLPGTYSDICKKLHTNNLWDYYAQFIKSYKQHTILKYSDKLTELLFIDWYLNCKNKGYNESNYFYYNFYELSNNEKIKFISAEYRKNLIIKLNKNTNLSRKDIFYNKFGKDFIKRDIILLNKCNYENIQQFFKNHVQGVLKPADGQGGKGVQIVDHVDPNILGQHYLLEELITQHQELSKVNDTSRNTARIVTLVDVNDQVHIIAAAARFGLNDVVDNFHSGGIALELDINTGKAISSAIDIHGNRYINHPKTNYELKNFIYPCWDKVFKLATDIALACKDDYRYIGIDLIVNNKNEADVVEINRCPASDIIQIPSMIGKKELIDPIYNELVASKIMSKRTDLNKLYDF